MDLAGTAAAAGERTGVIWTLLESDDLNANLFAFLFGSILTVSSEDLVLIAALGLGGLAAITFLYRGRSLGTRAFRCRARRALRPSVRLSSSGRRLAIRSW